MERCIVPERCDVVQLGMMGRVQRRYSMLVNRPIREGCINQGHKE